MKSEVIDSSEMRVNQQGDPTESSCSFLFQFHEFAWKAALFTLRSSGVYLLIPSHSNWKCAEEKLVLVFPLLFLNTIGIPG